MLKRAFSGVMLIILLVSMFYTMLNVSPATSWSNGGYSDDPSNPKYGTHDWIAQHALDWLPSEEKQFILDNLAGYLYGTELPDNATAPGGIGDTANHHVYYFANSSLQDDASAVRAQEEYDAASDYFKSSDLVNATLRLGIMTHYICDVAVFGHVMGSATDWGDEVHHSDYETYVNERTDNYTDEFNTYLVFDASLDFISAYNAACALAFDTTFDVDGNLTCVWMDQNYNWSNPTFKNRCGESLNLAVNYIADVLHTSYLETVLPIHNIDTGLNYTSIQGAINAPETLDGHTILVDAGTYYEHVTLNKSIALIGEDRSTTIIDGGGTGTVLRVIANNTVITGFTMRDSGERFVDGEPAIWCGIWVGGYEMLVVNTTVIDNTIKNNYIGAFLWTSMNSTLIGNNIENNTNGVGLYQIFWNNIQHNTVLNNNGGIKAQYVLQSNISDNIITSNVLVGLTMQDSSFNTIDENHIENNGYGIDLSASNSNNITRNTLTSNKMGISLASSSNNNIYNNNFICNTKQVINTNSNNTWNDSYPSGGNYWSDYTGVDLYKGPYQNQTGSDGIGDTPYIIDVNNRDKYPLMSPLGVSLYVAPSLVEFWTPAYGKTFTVDVKIGNVAKLYGFEFKLYWNTTLLDLMNVNITPPSVWGTNYFVGMNETREDLGRCWLAVAALSPAPSFNGSATLVKLTFKIACDLIYPNNVTSCLDLVDTQLSDLEADPIPHNTYDGEYWCYSTKPKLEAKPPTYTAKILGENFTVNITIANIVNLYSFEFQISYNTTLLDATGVTIGPFLKSPYHITKNIIDEVTGLIWLSIESQPPAPSTNGSGTLATITFTVPMDSGIWYKGFISPECDLHFNGTMLKTDQGVTVPHDAADPLLHYKYTPIPGDLNSDGIVNIFDLRIAAKAFGSKPGEPNWDPRADLNHDNKVDIYDLVLIAKNYGRTTP